MEPEHCLQLTLTGIRGRYREGGSAQGRPLGPPEIDPFHVPVPPAETSGGFSGSGGFGRGAIGPLPPGYPAPAQRLLLRDLHVLVQLCGAADEGAPPCLGPLRCLLAA